MKNDNTPSVLQFALSSAWPQPSSRNFAELSDPILFAEVLEVTHKEDSVSLQKLTSETEGLRKRLRRLWVIDKPTMTTINGLLSAMTKFGWLKENGHGSYSLTPEGSEMYKVSRDERLFRRKLAKKMYDRYVVPGWFVYRLHSLNPHSQGEIVLPSPPKEWQPAQKKWASSKWTKELSEQVVISADKVNKFFPEAFPIDSEIWIQLVKDNWEKISNRKLAQQYSENNNSIDTRSNAIKEPEFTPRARLTQAMREAAINHLFDRVLPYSSLSSKAVPVVDFYSNKHPIPPRAFSAWCPRLEALELIFYTDFHPLISGRLMFPCGVFRESASYPPFEDIPEIIDPLGRNLYLYQPKWQDIRENFSNALLDTYQRYSKKMGALYISLLDVRDEVCRQLKLSSILFDSFVEAAYRESIEERTILRNFAISLESDIRAEQHSGYGLLRRPVYITKIPHSLIAISHKRRR